MIEEVQDIIYFDNVVAVLYRKDKEIPNNVIFWFKGNQCIRQFLPRKQEAKNQVILIYEEEAMKSLLTTRELEDGRWMWSIKHSF